jgi:TATA-box binding protein (TBP) (component of TFIID and TFIIIB)
VIAFRICNRASTFNIEATINLTRLETKLKADIQENPCNNNYNSVHVAYQPEKFNGLRLRLRRYISVEGTAGSVKKGGDVSLGKEESPSALIFSNGKVILTGCNSKESLDKFTKTVYSTLDGEKISSD